MRPVPPPVPGPASSTPDVVAPGDVGDAAGPPVDEVVAGADADPRVTRVRQALADAGAEADVVVLDHVPGSVEDLAAEVGAPAGALVRCHLLMVEDVPPGVGAAPASAGAARALLVLAPVRRRLLPSEVAGVAASLGVEAVRRPPPEDVRALTGCSPEDLPPVGLGGDHLVVVAVLVDTALGAHEVLWVPAGRPGTVLAVGHTELLRLTLGHAVELA